MAYRLRRTGSVQKSVRKIAIEQIDKAIDEIRDDQIDHEETIHQVRKRCKKLRGLIRLVRPAFADYKSENTFFRDTARELSHVRDAQVALETFDALMKHVDDESAAKRFERVRDALAERATRVTTEKTEPDERLQATLRKLQRARRRAKHWKIDHRGFRALEGGLTKTYKRARRAMRTAYGEPKGENFHDWRKRVKYHWYHLRLLRQIWQPMMQVGRSAADELGDLLGDDHDLVVLRDLLREDPGRFGGKADVRDMVDLIDRRSERLRAEARPLGERLLAESGDCLSSRLHRYWQVWRKS